jgi:hypothetical protein
MWVETDPAIRQHINQLIRFPISKNLVGQFGIYSYTNKHGFRIPFLKVINDIIVFM